MYNINKSLLKYKYRTKTKGNNWDVILMFNNHIKVGTQKDVEVFYHPEKQEQR